MYEVRRCLPQAGVGCTCLVMLETITVLNALSLANASKAALNLLKSRGGEDRSPRDHFR